MNIDNKRICDNCGTELLDFARLPDHFCRPCEYLASKLPHRERYLTNRRWQVRWKEITVYLDEHR